MNSLRLETDGSIETIAAGDQPALLAGLARQVDPAPGYTLRSFFNMLSTYEPLTHLSAFFPDLLEQARQAPAAGCITSGIDRLIIGKTVGVIGFPGDPRLEIYRTFTGQCDDRDVPIKDCQVDMLLDTPLCLGQLQHVIFGDQVDVFRFDTVFTLFEFVEGIGWELGFHGTPRECQIRR